MFIYLLCHLHFGINIGFLTQFQQFSRYGKVAFDGILFPNPMGHFGTGVLQLFLKSSVVLEQLQNKPLEYF